MTDNMYYEKEQKEWELSSYESERSALEKGLEAMKDPKGQVNVISKFLSDSYEAVENEHPIDRSQEPVLSETIDKYKKSIEWAMHNYHNYRNKKKALDELKSLFSSLKMDIEFFYEKGISKCDLDNLVGIMNTICSEGSRIGIIPQSYLSTVKKWESIASELPLDNRRIDKENEKAEQIKVEKKLKKAEKERDKLKTSLEEQATLLSAQEEILNKMEADLKKLIDSKPKKISRIKNQYEKKEAELLKSFKEQEEKIKETYAEKRVQLLKSLREQEEKIRETYAAKRLEFNSTIEKKRQYIDDTNDNIHVYTKLKSSYENELSKTPAIYFKKKRQLRYNLSNINRKISDTQKELEIQEKELVQMTWDDHIEKEMEEKLTALKNELAKMTQNDPIEKEMEEKLSELKNEHEEQIRQLDESQKESIAESDKKTDKAESKLKASIEKTTSEISVIQDSINSLQAKMNEKIKSIEEQKSYLKDFHNIYLIQKFGKKVSDYKIKRLKTVIANIESLNKELKVLNKTISKAEIEMKRQAEKNKKEQMKKLREREMIKKEQEQRQKRIEQEMIERGNEQDLLSSRADLLADLENVIKEINDNDAHYLLSDDNCPFSDDGSRIITNGIVRKTYTLKSSDANCKQYVLLFVDTKGKPISEQRIVQNKGVGSIAETSFQLKSDNGFNDSCYYLIVINFDTNEVICAQKYKIKIAFSNDFDF